MKRHWILALMSAPVVLLCTIVAADIIAGVRNVSRIPQWAVCSVPKIDTVSCRGFPVRQIKAKHIRFLDPRITSVAIEDVPFCEWLVQTSWSYAIQFHVDRTSLHCWIVDKRKKRRMK